MLKKLLLASVVSLFAGSAYAACTPPLNVKDGGGSTVPMSVTQGADGSCQYKIDIDTSSQIHADLTAPATVVPTTTGGLSVYNVQPTASDNHVVIKAGAGQVYKIDAFNNSATVNYIRLYNATTGFNGCNSATNLVWQGIIPASTSGAGLSSSWDLGIAFATGISICVTSGYAQTDTTNATASALVVNVGYK